MIRNMHFVFEVFIFFDFFFDFFRFFFDFFRFFFDFFRFFDSLELFGSTAFSGGPFSLPVIRHTQHPGASLCHPVVKVWNVSKVLSV